MRLRTPCLFASQKLNRILHKTTFLALLLHELPCLVMYMQQSYWCAVSIIATCIFIMILSSYFCAVVRPNFSFVYNNVEAPYISLCRMFLEDDDIHHLLCSDIHLVTRVKSWEQIWHVYGKKHWVNVNGLQEFSKIGSLVIVF